jgi:hypothetical protein
LTSSSLFLSETPAVKFAVFKMASMITSTAWVPRGFAAPFPTKYNFDEEEFERIAALAKLQLDDAKEDLEEAQEEEEEEAKPEKASKKEKKGKKEKAAAEKDDDASELVAFLHLSRHQKHLLTNPPVSRSTTTSRNTTSRLMMTMTRIRARRSKWACLGTSSRSPTTSPTRTTPTSP